MNSATATVSLPALLEARSATPADISPDGQMVLVLSNLSGTMQACRVPATGGNLVQLTDFEDAVASARFLEDGRVLTQKDEGGNERHQLYLVDPTGGTRPAPLVYEPEFMHIEPHENSDGSLLAYACNRRNGVDFDVFVRNLRSGTEQTVFAPGGMTVPTGFSPNGRWLSTQRLSKRPGDNDVHLIDLRSGEVVHATPHDDEALFDRPAWLPDASAFIFATNSGREFAGIARYDLSSHSWCYVHEADWDLSCSIDRRGQTLLVELNEDGSPGSSSVIRRRSSCGVRYLSDAEASCRSCGRPRGHGSHGTGAFSSTTFRRRSSRATPGASTSRPARRHASHTVRVGTESNVVDRVRLHPRDFRPGANGSGAVLAVGSEDRVRIRIQRDRDGFPVAFVGLPEPLAARAPHGRWADSESLSSTGPTRKHRNLRRRALNKPRVKQFV